ncbi:MAG: endonuclease MutS2, partial [Chloroflexota bacterium]|nr:endonuclease MutS2 [Chloroflexota bacterium]
MTIHTKSFVALEMPLVLEQLAEHCQFSASRELAINLRPANSIEVSEYRLNETTEARTFLNNHPHTSIENVSDVRDETNRARLSAILQPVELVRIRSILVASRELKKTILAASNETKILFQQAQIIVDLPNLEDAIGRCLNEQAEVLSTASTVLEELREKIKDTNNDLLQKLEHITNNPNNIKFLQESIITQRSDRYVVLLKSNFKGRIPGIVHGESTSGSTLFVEPIVTVDLNNQLQQLQIDEQKEIMRVLQILSEKVGELANEIENNVETIARLDLAFARAKHAEALTATQPILLPWDEDNNQTSDNISHGCTIKLLGARHPLLSKNDVVAIDFVIDNHTKVIVITGPNTGGKTVSLKTIGLLSLMAASGLHIPVEPGSALPIFSGIFADIGDEQSIKQSLSTFSSHINNIKSILKNIGSRSLVLLDEIGAGTDPGEGSALAQALLEYVLEKESVVVVTTHYQRLKLFSHNTDGVQNASV